MSAIVHKANTDTVCLSQATSVAEDGLVTVRARFMLPNAGSVSAFALDSTWPGGSSPRGLPANQGGPYLVSRDFQYTNGLVFVDATYVTATNPVRVVYSEQRSTRAFTGIIFVRDPNNAQATIATNAKFDYVGTVASARYTILDRGNFSPDLSAARINYVIGVSQGITDLILQKTIDSENREIIGRVHRVTKQREIVFYSE